MVDPSTIDTWQDNRRARADHAVREYTLRQVLLQLDPRRYEACQSYGEVLQQLRLVVDEECARVSPQGAPYGV